MCVVCEGELGVRGGSGGGVYKVRQKKGGKERGHHRKRTPTGRHRARTGMHMGSVCVVRGAVGAKGHAVASKPEEGEMRVGKVREE